MVRGEEELRWEVRGPADSDAGREAGAPTRCAIIWTGALRHGPLARGPTGGRRSPAGALDADWGCAVSLPGQSAG
jgi:hypothetical protein